MAVVQISKIQLRRGQKNSESGIPQLSSAEMAWAVDTQELYIGNGSVAEGAPYVGNTKVLTEHDDILDLASSYQFASNDSSITLSVPRSLQSKIDEIQVSVLDFGARNDGIVDNVEAFEIAFSELFDNTVEEFKKVLIVPNGVYSFQSDLHIPRDVIIRGETRDGVIFAINNNNIRFDGATPESISISNLTITRTTGQIVLSKLKNSVFEDVIISGVYSLGDSVSSVSAETGAIEWTNTNIADRVQNVKFIRCQFNNNSISVKMLRTPTVAVDNSIQFIESKFFRNYIGAYIDSRSNQKNAWQFNDCEFEEIFSSAFRSSQGINTFFNRCNFLFCGNGVNSSETPIDPIVQFGQPRGNILVDCYSDRQQIAAVQDDTETDVSNVNLNTYAVAEVVNGDRSIFVNRNYASISTANSPTPFAALSALNKNYTINYSLKLGSFTRHGSLFLAINEASTVVSITDHYQYSSLLVADTGGELLTDFEFTAVLRDNNNDTTNDTVILSYRNINGPSGSLSFDVAYNR